jgi:RIO kinase 1
MDVSETKHGQAAFNSIKVAEGKAEASRTRSKDKADRATTEQVLDPRTRMKIFHMIAKGHLASMNGCISTGKEANVYHAVTPDGAERAIKVYKTSILVFKDRDRYVTGEYRFRQGYSRSNPRKMVSMWCEKEYRNLARIRKAGIACPEPYRRDDHVLLMDFVGTDGTAAPRLHNAAPALSAARMDTLYYQNCIMLRQLFQDAGLVHADMSEYNILYHNKRLMLIDVSQSVEHEHPLALVFLRMDIHNMTQFYRRSGVLVLKRKELYDFVTCPELPPLPEGAEPKENADPVKAWLSSAKTVVVQRPPNHDDDVEGDVFMGSFIPQTLEDVFDVERDAERILSGDGDDLVYRHRLRLRHELERMELEGVSSDDDSNDDSNDDSDSDDSSVSGSDGQLSDVETAPRSDLDPRMLLTRADMSKEEWKAEARRRKELRREGIKDKKPKAQKKREKVIASRRRRARS